MTFNFASSLGEVDYAKQKTEGFIAHGIAKPNSLSLAHARQLPLEGA